MKNTLESLFGEGTITVYDDLSTDNLTHTYVEGRDNSKGKLIDFEQVVALLNDIQTDVEEWYEKVTGKPFDRYNLGDMFRPSQEKIWQDSRFQQAFDILELDYADIEKATIPWWNEIAAGETDHVILPDGLVHVTFGPRHSLETQLMRAGVERAVRNVSVGGILNTLPEEDAPEGYDELGLRGGSAFPKTYHINAGALMVAEDFKKGQKSIYDIFKDKELTKEFGITDKDIDSVKVLSRINDNAIDKGPMYVFLVKSKLTREQLQSRWEENLDPDKKEHDMPIFIRADADSINQFIDQNYRGLVQNRVDRLDNERYLLHPGALALASRTGREASTLSELYVPGQH